MKILKNPLKKLLMLNDNAERVARSFAIGSFIGMMPIPGFQVLIALFISTLFKLNKKATCIAVFNTNLFTGLFIFSFNFWLGKNILNISPAFNFPEKLGFSFIITILEAGSDVFLSLLVGGIVTGIIFSALVYPVIKYVLPENNPK